MKRALVSLIYLCCQACGFEDDARSPCSELECFSVKCPDSPTECLCYPSPTDEPIACEGE